MTDKKFCTSGGWAAKIAPKTLEQILQKLPKGKKDENLIVGYDTKDDAAVYKINDDVSVIETLDFFPPMVEDPYIFGQIAATNALSDIYAMGGKPIMALNIACFPEDIEKDVIEKILKGGAEKIIETGATLCGGHTIADDGVKYGLAVTGLVDTNKILKNNNVRIGDKLILTKPLGVGIVTTANACDVAKDDDYERIIKQMTTLNKYAAEILFKYNVSALTDITGFGLFNHLCEMVEEKASAKLYKNSIPLVSKNVIDYAKDDYYTGASGKNELACEGKVDYSNIEDWLKYVCLDPQTSGGLLAAVSKDDVENALKELNTLDIKSAIIGEVIEKTDKVISFV